MYGYFRTMKGQTRLISVRHGGRVRFFLPMAGTFMAFAGAWLTVRNGGILKVLVAENSATRFVMGEYEKISVN